MIDARALEAIESTDTDELLRIVDRYCDAGGWEDLLELRRRCDEAVSRGKQVWGVEEHIRYRLVLEGPPSIAGPIVTEGHSRFSLGPFPEVAASTKTWAQLEPHLGPGPDRDVVAAERVVRGEEVGVSIPDLPSRLMRWEPSYPVATYKKDKVEAPSPAIPATAPVKLPDDGNVIEDPQSSGALGDLVEPWTDQSNGRSQVAVVEGDHLAAVSSLGLPYARLGEMNGAEAMAWMAWAGASGGAHGRRRGSAAGRYLAWWVVASLADLDWPTSPEDLDAALRSISWHWFDDGAPDTGWVLRMAAVSRELGIAWAISATDQM